MSTHTENGLPSLGGDNWPNDFYPHPGALVFLHDVQLPLHGVELQEVYESYAKRYHEAMQSNIKRIGPTNRFPTHGTVLRFFWQCVACVLWFSICLLLAQFNLNCRGGRSIVGWLVTFALLAVATAQFVASLLRTFPTVRVRLLDQHPRPNRAWTGHPSDLK
jgi:hypothetical protein